MSPFCVSGPSRWRVVGREPAPRLLRQHLPLGALGGRLAFEPLEGERGRRDPASDGAAAGSSVQVRLELVEAPADDLREFLRQIPGSVGRLERHEPVEVAQGMGASTRSSRGACTTR